jgi:excisionase family DNA binding protein
MSRAQTPSATSPPTDPALIEQGLGVLCVAVWRSAHASPSTSNQKVPVMRVPQRQSRMLSKQRVADLLGLSLKTITRKIQSGELRSHCYGRAVRIAEEDLASFTAARRR